MGIFDFDTTGHSQAPGFAQADFRLVYCCDAMAERGQMHCVPAFPFGHTQDWPGGNVRRALRHEGVGRFAVEAMSRAVAVISERGVHAVQRD